MTVLNSFSEEEGWSWFEILENAVIELRRSKMDTFWIETIKGQRFKQYVETSPGSIWDLTKHHPPSSDSSSQSGLTWVKGHFDNCGVQGQLSKLQPPRLWAYQSLVWVNDKYKAPARNGWYVLLFLILLKKRNESEFNSVCRPNREVKDIEDVVEQNEWV